MLDEDNLDCAYVYEALGDLEYKAGNVQLSLSWYEQALNLRRDRIGHTRPLYWRLRDKEAEVRDLLSRGN